MRGGGHHVEAGVERVAHHARGDQPADVGDVGHRERLDLVGDLLEGGVVVVARVGGVAAQHHPRPRLLGRLLQVVEVDGAALVGEGLVADEVEHLAHVRDRRAVGQVAAVGEVHGQDRVAGLQEGEIDRLVHRRARQRLHVGVLGAEEGAGAVARGALDRVGELLAAVVAPAGIALGVLVGQHRAQRRQHLGVGVVLRRDHLDAVGLAALLAGDGGFDLGVVGGESLAVGVHGRAPSSRMDRRPPRKHPAPRRTAVFTPRASRWSIPSKLASHAGRAVDYQRAETRGKPAAGRRSRRLWMTARP